MTTFQKVIKYVALALAMFIIINIASGILFGLYSLVNVLGLTKETNSEIENTEKITTDYFENAEIATLKIELQYANLTIKRGNTLKAESNTSKISYKQSKNQLIIKEEEHNWFLNNDASKLIVYIPEDLTFETVKITAGAGEIKIEDLETKELYFEIGAGKAQIEKLNVLEEAKIEGGAGKVEILSGSINNLKLNVGVGEFILNTTLTGKNDIKAGIGKLEIDLTDELENYEIKVNKGIGSIKIDGKEVANDTKYGDGKTSIKVDGGIGSIIIK